MRTTGGSIERAPSSSQKEERKKERPTHSNLDGWMDGWMDPFRPPIEVLLVVVVVAHSFIALFCFVLVVFECLLFVVSASGRALRRCVVAAVLLSSGFFAAFHSSCRPAHLPSLLPSSFRQTLVVKLLRCSEQCVRCALPGILEFCVVVVARTNHSRLHLRSVGGYSNN